MDTCPVSLSGGPRSESGLAADRKRHDPADLGAARLSLSGQMLVVGWTGGN